MQVAACGSELTEHYAADDALNILHASTDPDLLTRLREMLDSSVRADIAVGYFFMSGFGPVSAELSKLNKVRILVGRADREVIETVAAGLQQPDALKARLEAGRPCAAA